MKNDWKGMGLKGRTLNQLIQEKQECLSALMEIQNGMCFVCHEPMLESDVIELHHINDSDRGTPMYFNYVTDIEARFWIAHRKCHRAEHKRLKMSDEERKARKREKDEAKRERRRIFRLNNPLPPRPPAAPWNKDKTLGPLTPEHKQKISQARTGHSCSLETRRKLSEAAKGKSSPLKGKPGHPQSEETKRKISQSLKARGIKPPDRWKSA